MNLPNKLTMFRVVLIPFFVLFMLAPVFQVWWGSLIALIIFIVASLTDMLDGKIARKYNLVTNFGKFMDPLADKLLVSSALICFVALGRLEAWIVIIIIAREFIISGFRLVAADAGVVIAASMWGKVKTCFQMGLVILIIFFTPVFPGFETPDVINIVINILAYITAAITVISLIDYLVKNKSVMRG